MTRDELNILGTKIIGAAIAVHKELGPGLLESVYEYCLLEELKRRNIKAKRQVSIPVIYKGTTLNKNFVIDILVEDEVVLELKCVENLLPVHEVQTVTYMKLSNKRLGYVMNFNVPVMVKGIRRKVHNF